MGKTRSEHARLRAHPNHARRPRCKRPHAFDQGRNLFQLKHGGSSSAQHIRAAACNDRAAAFARQITRIRKLA